MEEDVGDEDDDDVEEEEDDFEVPLEVDDGGAGGAEVENASLSIVVI